MSPRSTEFLGSARDRLRGAGHALAAGDRDLAVSAAYYAMLYAARAALSDGVLAISGADVFDGDL